MQPVMDQVRYVVIIAPKELKSKAFDGPIHEKIDFFIVL